MRYLALVLVLAVFSFSPIGASANTSVGNFSSFASQYISVADNATLDITSDMTLEVWVYAVTLKDFDIGKWTATGNQRSYLFTQACLSANQIQFVLDQGGTGVTQESSNFSFPCSTWQNKWVHIALVFDDTANTIDAYYNGVLQARNNTGTVAGVFSGTAEFNVSSRNAGTGDYLNGALDEVMVWRGTRTNAQIINDMNCGVANPAANADLRVYYRFEGNYTDSSALANNATSHNGNYTISTTTPPMHCPTLTEFDSF